MTSPRRVDGIDISHHQSGKLDLVGAKKRGLKWMFHKATEGQTYKDPNYTKRRAEAKAAGLPFGAYHFARPDSKADAVLEARFFVSVAKPVPGDLRPALDLETHELAGLVQVRAWADSFIREVARLTGVKPIVYTPYDLGTADDGCIVWRPRYNDANTPPILTWDIWQFSNGVLGVPDHLEGIGRVDLNTMRTGLTVAQMQIPKPVVAKKPGVTIHTVTANIQNFNPNLTDKQVREDVAKVAKLGVDLALWQEIGEHKDVVAINETLEKLDPAWASTVSGGTGGKSNVTSWQQGSPLKAKGNVRLVKLADGLGAGSHVPDNWLTIKVFASGVAGVPDIEVHNIHYIQGAYSKPGQPGDADGRRIAIWKKDWTNHQKEVLAAHKAGRIVIFGGDWNRVGKDIPKFHKDAKWVIGGTTGIDHVGVLLPAGVTLELDKAQKITALHSDHDAKSRKLTFRPK